MPIHKFIFRLDYEANWKMFDRPGEVLEFLHSIERKQKIPESLKIADSLLVKLYPNLAHDSIAHRITATYDDGEMALSFTIEPIAIVLNVELAEPLDYDKIFEDEKLHLAIEVCSNLCEKFNIDKLQRAGLRTFYYSSPLTSRDETVKAFSKFVSPKYEDLMQENLGAVKDFGIHFVGDNEDGTQYRFATGPCLEGESSKWIQNKTLVSHIEEYNYSMIADADIFEMNFSRRGYNESKWIERACEKTSSAIQKIEKLLESTNVSTQSPAKRSAHESTN